MGATAELAAFVAGLRYEDLPSDVVERAQWAIADAVGVGVYGSSLEWSRIVADHAESVGGGGPATLWGRGARTTAPMAAMANGTAVHGIELDDRSVNMNVHNGAVTVPAVLALSESCGSDGRTALLATACGYELAFRVARATMKGIQNHYWSAVRSVFGAAASAAKILDLDGDGTASALGIAGSMASGLWEFKVSATGTMVKRLQGGGWPAHCGVTAAMLAARGLTGPSTILEGEDGACVAFCTAGEPDVAALTKGLGEDFQMRYWESKKYASWGGGHSSIDAVLQLREQVDVAPEDIERITVQCSSKTYSNTVIPKPDSIMAAQYNLRFIIAAAFRYDMRDPQIWNDTILRDQTVNALSDRVVGELDPEIDRIFQETNDHGGVRLVVDLRDGRQHQVRVRHASGTPDNPLSAKEIEHKMRTLSGQVLPSAKVDYLTEWAAGLRTAEQSMDLSWLHAN